MNPTLILAIQSALIFLQMVNAGLASMQEVPGWLTLVLGGLVGAGQFFIQHVGNQAVPPPAPVAKP